MTQIGLFLPRWAGVDWHNDAWPKPKKYGRGGFQTMVRWPDDPDEAGARGGAFAHARIAYSTSLKKGDPADFVVAIEELLHSDGRPRSFNEISVVLVDRHADVTCGSALEEALWILVELRSVRWCMPEPNPFGVLFAAWRLGDNLNDPPRAGLTDHRWTFRAGRMPASFVAESP